jgi:hypothetical protein
MKKYLIENNSIVSVVTLKKASDAPNYTYEDGWRDDVRPSITSIQQLGDIYYDTGLDKVTWTVVNLTLDPVEDLKIRKIEELDSAITKLYDVINWYMVKKWAADELGSVSQTIKDKIIEIDTKRIQIEANINALVTSEEVVQFNIPYNQIETLKDQLKTVK